MGFQGERRPKRFIYYSHTVWRLDNRAQWPENRTLDYITLGELDNFCDGNGKWSEIPYVQAFFVLHSWPSLCTSSSTSQILLAHSGPHPPSIISPDPCLDFSSSFDPSDHSAPPIASNPIVADPVPQPPPYIQSPGSSPLSGAGRRRFRPSPQAYFGKGLLGFGSTPYYR